MHLVFFSIIESYDVDLGLKTSYKISFIRSLFSRIVSVSIKFVSKSINKRILNNLENNSTFYDILIDNEN